MITIFIINIAAEGGLVKGKLRGSGRPAGAEDRYSA
jgi:hypothetical protein